MEEPYVEVHEAGKVRRIVLGNDPLTIGRHSDNRLILTDNLCSRFHCLIGKGRGGFTLRDLNSSNGTALNGRITKFSKLADGDAVVIGQTRILFHQPNGQVKTEADSAKPQAANGAEFEMTPLELDPVPEPEPLPPPVDLDAIPDELETAEALTDEDILEDEPEPEPAALGLEQ
ncbi:MAG TPA: FHA domain-containing protein, partial [Tepidisphaeraceae bacterium]|nr:FHA domain-containing protein [Tepidisphaeraceae bacterium]